jgi:hypothetical protein
VHAYRFQVILKNRGDCLIVIRDDCHLSAISGADRETRLGVDGHRFDKGHDILA